MSGYLVAAYVVFWGFTFAFVVSLWARQRRIQGDIERLSEGLESPDFSGK